MVLTLDTKRKQRFDFMRCLYDRTRGSEMGLLYTEEVAEEIQLPEFDTERIALYLADEGLIKIRLGHIISITHLGIDEVETVLAQPDQPTEHFPPLQATPSRPESNGEARRNPEREKREQDLPPLPHQPADMPDNDFAAMELKHICEAIGLDPREFTSEVAPAGSIALERSDSRTDVSDDVRKLIAQAEAASAQAPTFRPGEAEPSVPAKPLAARTRSRAAKPANRESTQAVSSRESDLADVLASLKLRLLKIRLAADDMGEAQAEIATAIAQLLSPRPKEQIITMSLTTLLDILEKAGPAALTKDVEASLAKLRAFLQQ